MYNSFAPFFMSEIQHNYRTRSISPENPSGYKGEGGMATEGYMADCAKKLGAGWKVCPSIQIKKGEKAILGDIAGSGRIRHIWIGGYDISWRLNIIRIYWDGSLVPSVECPLGDFFASAEVDELPHYHSLLTAVNPRNGCNCYWDMPYHKSCRITMENLSDKDANLYYQITYLEGKIPVESGYFHAQFRRSKEVPYKDVHTIADQIRGCGQYVGTYLYYAARTDDWWGEGELKFYMDGDKDFPTICGTGTEDYFGGGDGFLSPDYSHYINFCTSYCGFSMRKRTDLFPKKRFSMYRWHITDPIYFHENLKVTVQDLGWDSPDHSTGYKPLQDDISSVAFFYLDAPSQTMPILPGKEGLLFD